MIHSRSECSKTLADNDVYVCMCVYVCVCVCMCVCARVRALVLQELQQTKTQLAEAKLELARQQVDLHLKCVAWGAEGKERRGRVMGRSEAALLMAKHQ